MTTYNDAKRDLTNRVVDTLRENDGNLYEADDKINNASRRVISAMRDQHGEAWIGNINLHDGADHVLWKWDGGMVYNFGAEFVVPKYDAELHRLIVERSAAPYTGVAGDIPRVNAIIARIHEIGGTQLIWT